MTSRPKTKTSQPPPVTAIGKHTVGDVDGILCVDKVSVANLARPSCKRCHGVGVMGTLINRDGSRTRLVCSCVARNVAKIDEIQTSIDTKAAADKPV